MARECVYDDDGNVLFCYDDDVGLESLNNVGLDFPPPNDINYDNSGDVLAYMTRLSAIEPYIGDPDDIQIPLSTFQNFTDLYSTDELRQIAADYAATTGNPNDAYVVLDALGIPSTTEMENLIKQAENDTKAGGIMSGSGNPFGTQAGESRGETFLEKLGLKNLSGSDLLKGLAAAYMAKKAYDEGQQKKAAAEATKGVSIGKNAPVTATRVSGKGVRYSAMGGLQSLAQGGKSSLPPRYLDGHTDGMADKVPAHIDNRRPAALSDGEFVVPADVVSHLGNGNSTAGAKRLYEMMDRIRAARTGTTKQGKQINPDKFLPR